MQMSRETLACFFVTWIAIFAVFTAWNGAQEEQEKQNRRLESRLDGTVRLVVLLDERVGDVQRTAEAGHEQAQELAEAWSRRRR